MPAQKGFTLVELLVVISIIAILSVVGMTVFTGAQKSTRDARRRADIDAISKALELHYKQCPAPGTQDSYCALPGDYFSSGEIPIDPSVSRKSEPLDNTKANDSHEFGYIYGYGILPLGYRSDSTYIVCADLETVRYPGATVDWDGTQKDYCRANQQ